MKNTIYHNGVIDSIEGHTIFVRFLQESACVGCHARSMCSASESKSKIIEISDYSGAYQVNEEVLICGRSSLGLQAVFFAFIIPLIIVVAVIVIGTSFQWSEVNSALSGLLFLLLYYGALYLVRNKLKKRFVFTLKKLNP